MEINTQKLKGIATFRGAQEYPPDSGRYEWLVGYLFLSNLSRRRYMIRVTNPMDQPPYFTDYPVISESISQLTPFCDVGETDIYLGDIIDFKIPGSDQYSRGLVIFEGGKIMVQEKDGRKTLMNCLGGFKVWGNYFESPHLMDQPPSGLTEEVEVKQDTTALTLKDFEEGQPVTWVGRASSEHSLKSIPVSEPGVVKKVSDKVVYVVFNCGDDWENYNNYTGVGVAPSELVKGWPDQNTEHYILSHVDSDEWGNDDHHTPEDVAKLNARLMKEGSRWRWIKYSIYENEQQGITD